MAKIWLVVASVWLTVNSICNGQQENNTMTGLDIITNLNSISIAYQDLTFLLASLSGKNGESPKTNILVSSYQNLTRSEVSDEKAPQPTQPFSLAVQIGLVSASHSVVLADREFLLTLQKQMKVFSLQQKRVLAKVIQKQISVVKTFDRDDSLFGPKVLNALENDDAALLKTLKMVESVFAT